MKNSFVAAADNIATPTAFTANGAPTNVTSGDRCLDLFSVIGSKTANILDIWQQAYYENPQVAIRILLWSYDMREGAGRRDNFIAIMRWLEVNNPNLAIGLLPFIPHFGRWKELLSFELDSPVRHAAYEVIWQGLNNKDTAGLAAKWMDRQDRLAREYFNMTPKKWRKFLVERTDVVETKMCDKEWGSINYQHVPSVAGQRYRKAFTKHDATRYNQYIESVAKGEAKINTSVLFPHDVIRGIGNSGYNRAVQVSWDNLPSYYDPSKNKALVMIDTSGSMSVRVSGSISAMDISTSLGIYVAQRNKGPFANRAISFSSRPNWLNFTNMNLQEALRHSRTNSGYSTNLQGAFDLILSTAVQNRISQEDMPDSIIVISDMEFDNYSAQSNKTNFEHVEDKYRAAGYKRPNIIWWNVAGRAGNSPTKKDDYGNAMVSGYSPRILQSVLGNDSISPLQVVLDTVGKDRYTIKGITA